MKIILSDNSGFTLLEVLVAMGIFLLMIFGVSGIWSYASRSKNVIWEQLSAQNEGRKTVQDFTNELRTATQSSIGSFAIESPTTSSLIFYSNIDSDSWRERVRYFLAGSILKKGVTKPSGNPLSYSSSNEVVVEVAHGVTNGNEPIFTYYGENYNGATSTSTLSYPINVTTIRLVGIKLRLERYPDLSPAPVWVESKVEIRNLKAN